MLSAAAPGAAPMAGGLDAMTADRAVLGAATGMVVALLAAVVVWRCSRRTYRAPAPAQAAAEVERLGGVQAAFLGTMPVGCLACVGAMEGLPGAMAPVLIRDVWILITLAGLAWCAPRLRAVRAVQRAGDAPAVAAA